MASINFIIDTKGLERKLTKLERQVLPAARIRAMNDVAFQARGTVAKLMPLVFDQPTAFTTRAALYTKATPARPVAEVFIRNDAAKGTPPATYLQPQVRGGFRSQKGAERQLARAGIIGRGEGWVPARAMRLNRYGNVPSGKVVQMLSQIRAFGEQGYQANVTARSRARGKAKGRGDYFVPNPATRNRLPRGVYERYGPGKRRIRPVMLFVKLPSYRPQLDFSGAVRQDINRRLPDSFRRALAYELRRAGLNR